MQDFKDLENFLESDDRSEIKTLKELYETLKFELSETITGSALSYCEVGSENHCGDDIDYDYIWIDDSEIKINKDGSFCVTDIHETHDVFNCTGNDVVDFYIGIYAAYESDFNPNDPESFFNKGFKITMKGLFNLEESNSSHLRNLN